MSDVKEAGLRQIRWAGYKHGGRAFDQKVPVILSKPVDLDLSLAMLFLLNHRVICFSGPAKYGMVSTQTKDGLNVRADRGSQYCSHAFQEALKAYGMRSSMSRKGNCWDNVPTESLWASLKVARIHG